MRTLGFVLGFTAMVSVLLLSCSSDDSTGTNGAEEFDLARAEEDMAAQIEYYDDLTQLAASIDTASALDSLVVLLEQDPDVLWATNVNTGVNVQWQSGLRGVITIRTWARQLVSSPRPVAARLSPPASLRSMSQDSEIYTIPTHRRSLYLAPCYSEFQTHDDTVIEWGRSGLAEAGYDTFAVYKETDVDLARLRSLSSGEWGLIRISSHGAPYPSQQTVEEVYLLTGEQVTDQGDLDNVTGLNDGTIAVNTYFGTNYYSVAPAYIVHHNNFGSTNPLFMNGFCYSHLGEWSTSLRSAGAGGVFGWDWECYAGTDAAYVTDLLTKMCDRERSTPYTLQRWFAAEDPYFQAGERTVHGCIAAADSFALWPPSNVVLDSLQYDAVISGDEMYIYGRGFGPTWGQVLFGTTSATPGPSYTWSDTYIYVVVPDGLEPGSSTVKVVTAAGEESNELSIYIQDELMDVLHSTARVEIFFSAHHLWDPWQTENDTAFSLMHQELHWQENTFFGRETLVSETRNLRMDIVGAINLAEQTCALEYDYADTATTTQGGHVIISKKASFRDVPFTGMGFSHCSFGAEGSETVPALIEGTLEYHRTTHGDVGSQFPGEYVETYWEYGTPRLSFDFEF